MRRLIWMPLLLIVMGCAHLDVLEIGRRTGFGYKTVAGKEEPSTLVAVDGSQCHVGRRKFEGALTGDRVWCAWRSRG